jgi:hypothetical protein
MGATGIDQQGGCLSDQQVHVNHSIGAKSAFNAMNTWDDFHFSFLQKQTG